MCTRHAEALKAVGGTLCVHHTLLYLGTHVPPRAMQQLLIGLLVAADCVQCMQVLHLLGEMAPETAEPSRFVRFMYNRVILENATVRAAAVSSLAAIGARCPSLRDRIVIILRRSLADSDDEVASYRLLTLFDASVTLRLQPPTKTTLMPTRIKKFGN